jgi:C1A family cysteine protease
LKLLIPLFILSFSTSAAWIDSCKSNKKFIEGKLEKIEDNAGDRDVSKEIDSLIKTVKYSCPEESKKKLIEKSFNDLKIQGYKSHLDRMMDESKRVSDYRSPDWEYEELKRVSELLKVKNPMSKERFNSLSKIGKKNSLKKKKSCTNIDNRKEPLIKIVNGKKVDVVRDQDSIGWCYAFAAADLISHKVGKKVSATDIANGYNDGSFGEFFGKKETDMEGGFTASAANIALKKGLCLEKNLPSDDYEYSTNFNLKSAYDSVEKLYENYRKRVSYSTRRGTRYLSGAKLKKSQNKFKKDLLCNKIDHDANEIFPNVSLEEVYNIVKSAGSSNDLIDKLVKKSCEPRIKPNVNLSFEADGDFTFNSTMLKTINKKLDSGDILGIHYKAGTLRNLLDSPSSGRHASLIVARRFNEKSGSCDYLIRNSWGKTYGPSYDERTDSENGNHWMPEEYLMKTMHGISYAN